MAYFEELFQFCGLFPVYLAEDDCHLLMSQRSHLIGSSNLLIEFLDSPKEFR